MGTSTIPVDLFNPGQVFACLGLLEAAETLVGGACGGFDWNSDPERPVFQISAVGDEPPVAAVLRFLADADVGALAPPGTDLGTEKWDVHTTSATDGAPFPFPAPDSPATLPAELHHGGHRIVVDHWGDTRRDNVKFWAGSGGYPGVGLLRDALDLVRDAVRQPDAAVDPFSLSAPQSSSFRFDWRRDYVPLGVGFSLNAHPKMNPQGYPLVEVLAAIGLSHARPERPTRRDKLLYRYGALAGREIPLPLHRAALGGAALPFPTRTFRMVLAWPGKAGQARCITDVVEETRS